MIALLSYHSLDPTKYQHDQGNIISDVCKTCRYVAYGKITGSEIPNTCDSLMSHHKQKSQLVVILTFSDPFVPY